MPGATTFLYREIIDRLFFALRGFESPLSFAYRQKAASNTPSGMERKCDPAAKGTDLKALDIRRQLRQDCIGARHVRKYRQVLLQAQPNISRGSAGSKNSLKYRPLSTVQRCARAVTRASAEAILLPNVPDGMVVGTSGADGPQESVPGCVSPLRDSIPAVRQPPAEVLLPGMLSCSSL